MDYINLFHICKQHTISGRYIHLKHIEPLLLSDNRRRQTSIIGHSVLGKPIYKYVFGMGKIKILMWSQMHGNESTTTKAVFDMLNFFELDNDFVHEIFKRFTIYIVPILNPDGAELYTRENAKGIDLNRDALDLSQPESRILNELFNAFKPDFCYNLHDQRTIYGVGNSILPATVSFLAPAYDEAREFNVSRNAAVSVICKMNQELQKHIPNQVGRFDDGFNPNCVGDSFQMCGVPTILFEAGHFPEDYDREETRKYIFIALLTSFKTISDNDIVDICIDEYIKIPLNNTRFLDIIYKNVKLNYDNSIITTNFAAQYCEKLINNKIVFSAYIEKIGDLDNYLGHTEYDLECELYKDDFLNYPVIGQKANFFLTNGTNIVNGLHIKNRLRPKGDSL